MARITTVAVTGACFFSFAFAQGDKPKAPPSDQHVPLRTLQHNAFKAGEKLSYVLHYGWINAGEAVIELKETDKDVNGRKLLHAVGRGWSVGAFNAFFKVDDYYETYIDEQGVFPWIFLRRVNEGGYIINQDYVYKQTSKQVVTQDKKTYSVPAHVQDMISAFYYARTWDFTKITPGQEFTIDMFMDNELYPLRMRYVGKEKVKLRNGKYRCLKFQPIVQEGRVFKDSEDLNVWITDDGNHIPVLVQAKILVGSIKMELTASEGLANPLAKE